MRPMSGPAVASLTAQETDQVWLVLLTVDHAELEEPIRVVSDYENITSNGDVYVGYPFELDFPEEGPDSPGEAVLRIDNVDKLITETLRAITTPPRVTIQVVLASSPDTIELLIDNLTLRDVSYDAAVVEGRLRLEDVAVEPVAEIITPARFPALF